MTVIHSMNAAGVKSAWVAPMAMIAESPLPQFLSQTKGSSNRAQKTQFTFN